MREVADLRACTLEHGLVVREERVEFRHQRLDFRREMALELFRGAVAHVGDGPHAHGAAATARTAPATTPRRTRPIANSAKAIDQRVDVAADLGANFVVVSSNRDYIGRRRIRERHPQAHNAHGVRGVAPS